MAKSVPRLFLLLYMFCLIKHYSNGVKIGISQSSSTSTVQPPTTNAAPTSSSLDLGNVSSVIPEETTTVTSIPPRTQKQSSTTATPVSTSVTIATDSLGETQILNVTAMPSIPVLPGPVLSYAAYYCPCDVLADACDPNCCCDRDCKMEILKVFDCLTMPIHAQLQTRLEDFHYTHGLPSCKLNDGWLCVFRTNIKPTTLEPLSNNFNAKNYKKWPELLRSYETIPFGQDAQYYKFGQPLQMWQPDTKELTIFELPSAYDSAYCQFKHPISHLEPMTSNCLLTGATELQHNVWKLLNLTITHRLLPKPHSVQDMLDHDIDTLTIQICRELSEIELKFACLDNASDLSLDDLLSSIELRLFHNYTHILAAVFLLKDRLPDKKHSNNRPLWLHYEVRYVEGNVTDLLTMQKPLGRSKPTSGALGYLQGAPILVAKLVPRVNTEPTQHILNYFQNNASNHWLPLFTKQPHSTACIRTNELHYAVQYGVNIVKECSLHKSELVFSEKNYTDYCRRLQADIWEQLLPYNCSDLSDVSQIFVSQLGRPQLDKWLPLQLQYADSELLPVYGEPNEELHSFSCRNMVLSVTYEFYIAEMTLLEGNVRHQRVLQHASLLLGERRDLEFDASEEQIDVPLTASVMFYNTQSKRSAADSTILTFKFGLLFSISVSMVGLRS